MLTQESVVDKIEVLESGHIQVRSMRRISDNGVVVAETAHRHVLSPGADITGEDARVQSIAAAVWTPEVIQAWQASQLE